MLVVNVFIVIHILRKFGKDLSNIVDVRVY